MNITELLKEKDKFILDENKNAIPATLMEWAGWLEGDCDKRIVGRSRIDDKLVSTVFLGLDHGYPELLKVCRELYKPKIFETMVFEKKEDIYCDRYSTWKEAEKGHQKAIDWVNNGCKDREE